jgi:chromosome segregation ATPase
MENPAEVQELRNKLRMMKFPQDEILNVVRRQQRAIVNQKTANETLRREVDQYESDIARIDDLMAAFSADPELQRLETTKKQFLNRLSVLQADFSVENGKRRKIEEEVSKARSRASGIRTEADAKDKVVFHMHTMENRLNKSYTKYSTNLASLSKLRAQLDEFRTQRNNFRETVRRQRFHREETEEEMGKLISESNEAYAQRDDLKLRLTRVRSAEKEAQQEFHESLDRITERIEVGRVAKNRLRVTETPMMAQESVVGSGADPTDDLAAQTEWMQATITQALSLAGYSSTEELVREADRLERENFSLYSCVVEVGSVNAGVQDELERLQKHRDQLDRLSEMTDEEQSVHLVGLTNQISSVSKELSESRSKFEQETEEFRDVYEKLAVLFNDIGCSWDGSPDNKTTVTQGNVIFVLSEVEKKLANVMDEFFEQARIEFETRGEDPTWAGSEPDSSQNRLSSLSREFSPRQMEHSRPLTIEEIQRFL